MTRTIGDCTWDELDPRVSRVPSVVPTFVPERVERRRRRLRALRESGESPADEAGPG